MDPVCKTAAILMLMAGLANSQHGDESDFAPGGGIAVVLRKEKVRMTVGFPLFKKRKFVRSGLPENGDMNSSAYESKPASPESPEARGQLHA